MDTFSATESSAQAVIEAHSILHVSAVFVTFMHFVCMGECAYMRVDRVVGNIVVVWNTIRII